MNDMNENTLKYKTHKKCPVFLQSDSTFTIKFEIVQGWKI